MEIILTNQEVKEAIEKYVREDVLDYSYKDKNRYAVVIDFKAKKLVVDVEEFDQPKTAGV